MAQRKTLTKPRSCSFGGSTAGATTALFRAPFAGFPHRCPGMRSAFAMSSPEVALREGTHDP